MRYVDMSYFVERKFHTVLAKMGKLPWVNFIRTVKDGKRATGIGINQMLPGLTKIANEHPEFNEMMLTILKAGSGALIEVVSLSRLFAYGPKMFQPDFVTCEALENIEINIPFSDYRQPYPALIIKFPDSYLQRMRKKFPESPSFHTLIVFFEENLLNIQQYGETNVQGERPCIATAVNTQGMTQTIEEFISNHDDTPDYNFVEHLQRIAINFCLLATHCGVRITAPLDGHAVKRSRKAKERFGVGDIYAAVLDQPIKLFTTTTYVPRKESNGGAHSSPEPHWRRGHWRMQACGTQLSLRKKVFIPCVFVRMEAHNSDPIHTSYKVET